MLPRALEGGTGSRLTVWTRYVRLLRWGHGEIVSARIPQLKVVYERLCKRGVCVCVRACVRV